MSLGPSHQIPFNRADIGPNEIRYVLDAIDRGHISADGWYSSRCEENLRRMFGGTEVLVVNSCTSALEIALMCSGIGPGDEVVLPSFTFVTTATAIVRTGATPVFVDIEPGRKTLDLDAVEAAIGPRTRVILPVHYAGVAPDMNRLNAIADARGLDVVEDCAQGLGASYRDEPLGSFGRFAAISFHETKNVVAGEGGALIINRGDDQAAAQVIRDKGTNRNLFNRGLVEKYTWIYQGSSFGLSDLNAAVLLAQLERLNEIQERRQSIWRRYHETLSVAARAGSFEVPNVPEECAHPAHMYYLLAPTASLRARWIAQLNERGVNAVFHYIPLHSSRGGLAYGRQAGSMVVTDDVAARLFRLPLWPGMTEHQVEEVIDSVLHLPGV